MARTVLRRRDGSLDPSLKRTNLKICLYVSLCLLVSCTKGTKISDLYQYRFTMMQPPTGKLNFEDDNLRFSFQPNRERIDLTIENKGTKVVELDWDEVEFEDRYGAVHKVTAQDVKFEEKDKPKAAIVIDPGKRLETWVLPSDHVKRSMKRWKVKPLFPELKTGADVDSWDRTTFKLVMPLKVGEEKKDYRFGFRVRID